MKKNHKYSLQIFLHITVFCLLAITGFITPNMSIAASFSCEPKLYQSMNTDLMLLDPETGTYNQVGSSASATYNAIGWDQRTNYIYGYRKATKRLFKIGVSGKTIDLGTPKEINSGKNIEVKSQSADMDANGNLWLFDKNEAKTLTRVNVDTLKYKKFYFSGATPDGPNDIVYVESANSFFGINKNSNKLIRFNLNNKKITIYDLPGLPPQDYDVPGYGAGWTNINSELYFAYNDGGIYKINDYLTTYPSATWIIDSQPSSAQDGASCPLAPSVFETKPTAGTGTLLYANSGNGQYKDRILFMDWKGSSLQDGIQDGDVVNFIIPASSSMPSGTLKATFTNIDDASHIADMTKPADMKTWDGAAFHQLYNTSGLGEAIYTPQINPQGESGEHHLSFDIEWEMTIDGQVVSPDIFLIDSESTTFDSEQIEATTNGGVWSVIENALNTSYVVDGIGSTQIQIKDTEDPPNIGDSNPVSTEGAPLLLSKGSTQMSISLQTINGDGGLQGVAFALLAPRDHGDAPLSYGDAIHAFKEEAIDPSKNQLGLKFKIGTPYIGATPPDSEAIAQQDEEPAQGDNNNKDAFDINRGSDEDIVIPALSLGQSIEITVPINGISYLSAWFDWNADGDFNDINEKVTNNLSVSTGNKKIIITVPNDAVAGTSYARFRLSSQQNLAPAGYAKDGEVEDVTFKITKTGECRIDDLTDDLYSTSSVSTNSPILNDSTQVYQAQFNNNGWTGQVLAYDLETSNDDGRVKTLQWNAADLLPRIRENIFSYNPTLSSSRGINASWDFLSNDQKSILNNNDDDISFGKKRLEWAIGSADNEGTLFRRRTKVLGDIIHSNLLFKDTLTNYGYSRLPEGGDYSTYLRYKQNTTPTIFIGANDGMLHAFNAGNGTSLFSYLPNEIFPKLVTISDPNYGCKASDCLPHEYLVDGKSALGDAYFSSSSDWHTVLVGGLGLGGKGVFALDVTDTENFTKNNVLWEISSTQATSAGNDASEFSNHLGNTIPVSSVVRMNNSDSNNQWAAVVGNGYDSASHQAVLFIINIETGELIKKINTGSGTEEQPNGLSSPIAVDSDNDSIADRIYAGDLLGNLWAFDVSDSNPNNWTVDFSGTPLFTANQSITAPPQVGRNPLGGLMVYFGTGKYFDVSDNFREISGNNTYYGIHDDGDVVDASSLIQQTILQESSANDTNYNARIISNNYVDFRSYHGWYMDLPTGGERVISQALLRQSRLIFTTMTPLKNVCEWGGTSWLMEFGAVEGKRLSKIPLDINNDKEFTEDDNVVYQSKKTIISGIQDESLGAVFSTPTVISHNSHAEGKYLTGTGGSIGMFKESTSRFTGRMSWKKIK